jgi:hypothetical protein
MGWKEVFGGIGQEMKRQVSGDWGVTEQLLGKGHNPCHCKRKKCNPKKCGCCCHHKK